MFRRRLPRSIALLVLAALPRPAHGEGITFGDWVLECVGAGESDKKICQLRQTLRDEKGRRLIEFVAKRTNSAAFLEVVAPLSLSIPYGVTILTGDDQPAPTEPDATKAAPAAAQKVAKGAAKPEDPKAPNSAGKPADAKVAKDAAKTDGPANANALATQLATCDPDGCRAVAPLDELAIAQLKAATRLAVMFQDSKTGKVVTITGSPKGFSDGIPMVMAAP